MAAVLICAPPASFRDAEKHCAAVELKIAGALTEAKDRVRTQAGEGLVSEGELGARIDAGPNRGSIFHLVRSALLAAQAPVAGATLRPSQFR